MSMVGRADALASASDVLDTVGEGPCGLVFDGPAGIGKTAVLAAVIDEAAGRGFRVLSTRPGEGDAAVALAGLVDLLEEVAPPVLHLLPRPQRAALSAALLDADTGAQELALGMGVRNVLRQVALAAPVLIAVDDLQWLDAASGRALEFALRRLARDPVALLATARGRTIPVVDVTSALPDDRLRRLAVQTLTRDEVAELLHARLDLELPPRALQLLYDTCGGNPMFALELARGVRAGTTVLSPGAPLALSASLRDLVAARLQGVDSALQDALLAIAALADPRVAHIRPDLLAEAEALDLLVLADGRVRFSHPLLREAVYERALPDARRECHRKLAAQVDDPVERAFHLALGTAAPDGAVADEVEAGASAAIRRGARGAAGALLDHAARLSVDPLEHTRRMLMAVEELHQVGDDERARALLKIAEAHVQPGPLRARARFLRSIWSDSVEERLRLLAEAGDEADEELLVHVLLERASTVAHVSFEEARRVAGAAAAAADRTTRDELVVAATSGSVFWDMALGRPVDHVRARHAVARAERLDEAGMGSHADVRESYGQVLTYAGDLARARPLLTAAARSARETGSAPGALLHLSFLEYRAGRLDRALQCVEEFERETPPDPLQRAFARFFEGFVHATVGDRSRLHDALAQAEARFVAIGDRIDLVGCHYCRGLVALSQDDDTLAADECATGIQIMRELGWREVGVHPIYQVCAEALIGLGRHDDAANLLDELESLANAIQRVPALAGASRARAALLCAAGDYDTAVSLCERSLELQSRLPEPFELARTRLVLGTILRRAQRKAPARRELERAISEFAAIGAHSWEQKAKAELRRIGGRAPSGGLTATEERVALLVARGKSNSEVAAALFVSPKTVEWNLSKIYRKLRVASRTELAARLARDHRPPA